ncbi:MAG: PASTA domain-containing protein [Ruminiclostridium sp.]|nr:PASTA domain-containing protein [Ruminiclostridium sp.]
MKRRMFWVVLALLILAAGYICTIIYNTTVVRSEYYRSKANSQQLSSYTITANRGTIYDRTNKILAQSTTVWDVVLSPKAIAEMDEKLEKAGKPPMTETICKTLSRLLGVDKQKIRDGCKNFKNEYFIVKKKVDKDTYDKIQAFITENKLDAFTVNLMESSKRYYPNDSLASSIIGFTNYDNEGVYGLEAYYDNYLQGTDGLIVMAKDAKGNAMPYDYENRYEASDGHSIILTLDSTVQYYLEKNLESAVRQHLVANRATGIIMNAKTGAIIAMATAPGYNLNNPSQLSEQDEKKLEELHEQLILDYAAGSMTDQDAINEMIEKDLEEERAAMREKQWKNKAVSELYFPGSVFKVITCASALEEEVIDLDSSFVCLGVYQVEDTMIHCWTTGGGHGTLSLQDALTKSCNPSFIQIGLKLGRRLFCNYFTAFGFTEKTGIDLPGEAAPLYVPYERMGSVELASSSFGQTNKITPIQMICAYNAAINGGYLVTPYVVDKIIDASGNVVKSAETTIKRQVISGETSALMRQLTENVVTANGGQNAYIAGYRIGGKSGTSQKLDEYHNSWDMRYVGSFCAYTPADDPEYIMLVCVDEPMGSKYYGSMVAAPVVSAVFSECLEYLGVYPQYTAEELEKQNTTVPYVYGSTLLDAISSLNARGLTSISVIGDESAKVDYTIPEAAAPIPKNGTVVIYMQGAEKQMVSVPDLTGCTVNQANNVLSLYGLNISLSGGGVNNPDAVATSQSIEPGKEVSKGTVIEVTFLVNNSDAG